MQLASTAISPGVPTDLTSVVMTLATSLDESSSATSSGTKTWSGRIDVAHELRENVTLLGGFGVEFEKFSGGTDTTPVIKSRRRMAAQSKSGVDRGL